jgi:ribulose 1,5-bisphosphate synthetase/thiazole synthase
MELSHAVTAVDVMFDESALSTDAGLVAALALAGQIGLPVLVAEQVVIAGGPTAPGSTRR